MTEIKKREITKISKQFASGFKEMFGGINRTGFFIVDPLSGYLSYLGYKNEVKEIPETENNPQIMMIIFESGETFIPAGGDLKYVDKKFKNWMWL